MNDIQREILKKLDVTSPNVYTHVPIEIESLYVQDTYNRATLIITTKEPFRYNVKKENLRLYLVDDE